jgi:alpha-ribazole phosphatase
MNRCGRGNEMMRLILVRHGETDWNAQRRYQGWSDSPLNDIGVRQADLLSARLAGERVGAVYTSDLQRAMQTAQAIVAQHALPAIADPRLREMSFGGWEGLTHEEIRARWPDEMDAWLCDPLRVAPPGGETLAQLADRVRGALDDIVGKGADQTVVLVSHGGPLRVLLCLALRFAVRAHWRFRVNVASVSELSIYDGEATLVRLNGMGRGGESWDN